MQAPHLVRNHKHNQHKTDSNSIQPPEKKLRKIGGRPPSKEPLSEIISGRFTKAEAEKINEISKSNKISPSSYLRKMTLKGKVTNAFSSDSVKTRNTLISIANNLNQLLKEAHTYGLVSLENQALRELEEVRSILKHYSKVRSSGK